MSSTDKNPNSPTPPRPETAPQPDFEGERNVIESSELVGRDGTIQIRHSGETYTLRITRNNRLILTK